jgi:hypothetical protein
VEEDDDKEEDSDDDVADDDTDDDTDEDAELGATVEAAATPAEEAVRGRACCAAVGAVGTAALAPNVASEAAPLPEVGTGSER